jgi:hypothetical protein
MLRASRRTIVTALPHHGQLRGRRLFDGVQSGTHGDRLLRLRSFPSVALA